MNFNKLAALLCGALVIVNVTYFVKGIKLGDEISYYEKELKVLQEENKDYEQSIYALESLSKTAPMAAELNFGKYNDPIFTDMPQYAYSN